MEKPLYIPPSKRTTGLKIWCSVCRTDVSETCHSSGDSLKKCKNGWAHSFRVSGYKKVRKERVVIKLKTRDLEEARREAMNIMAQIKNESEVRVLENKMPEVKPRLTLMEAMTLYIAHLSGERGPAHTLKVRTENHVKDVERTVILFAKTMKKKGLNPEKLDGQYAFTVQLSEQA
jgi:hypothetical protein